MELPQLHTRTPEIKEEDSRVVKWRQSKGWRKRKRINPVRVEQNRCSQVRARNQLGDIGT